MAVSAFGCKTGSVTEQKRFTLACVNFSNTIIILGAAISAGSATAADVCSAATAVATGTIS